MQILPRSCSDDVFSVVPREFVAEILTENIRKTSDGGSRFEASRLRNQKVCLIASVREAVQYNAIGVDNPRFNEMIQSARDVIEKYGNAIGTSRSLTICSSFEGDRNDIGRSHVGHENDVTS